MIYYSNIILVSTVDFLHVLILKPVLSGCQRCKRNIHDKIIVNEPSGIGYNMIGFFKQTFFIGEITIHVLSLAVRIQIVRT